MPVNFENLSQSVNKFNDFTSLAIKDGNVIKQNDLGAFQKLSSTKTLNTQALLEFQQLIAPELQQSQKAREFLEHNIKNANPLTASLIKTIEAAIKYDKIEANLQIDLTGILPHGHKTSFIQYSIAKGIDIENPDKLNTAIENYFKSEIIEKNIPTLTKIEGENGVIISDIIKNALGPDKNEQPANFLGKELTKIITNEGINGILGKIESFFAKQNAENIEILKKLNTQSLGMIAENIKTDKDSIAVLKDALKDIPDDKIDSFVTFYCGEKGEYKNPVQAFRFLESVSTKEFIDSLTKGTSTQGATTTGAQVFAERLKEAGLLESFTPYLIKNQVTQKAILAEVEQKFGVNANFSQKELIDIMQKHTHQFIAGHKNSLETILTLRTDHPEIAAKISEKKLGSLILPLIASKPAMEHLVSDKAQGTIFKDFNQLSHAIASNRLIDPFYGTDDRNTTLLAMVTIALSQSGIKTEDYPAILKNITEKFGPIASECFSLFYDIHSGVAKSPSLKPITAMLTETGGVFEQLALSVISKMPREQLLELKLVNSLVTPQADAELYNEATLRTSFIENIFENIKNGAELTPAFREKLNQIGIEAPIMEQAVFDKDFPQHAAAANMLKELSLTMFGDTGKDKSEIPAELVATIAKFADDKFSPELALRLVNGALPKQIISQIQNKIINTAEAMSLQDITNDFNQAIRTEIQKLNGVIDEIQAMPNLTPTEKTLAIDVALRHNNNDVDSLVSTAQSNIAASSNLSVLAATPVTLWSGGLAMLEGIKENINIKNPVEVNAMVALIVGGLDDTSTRAIVDNLNSDTFKSMQSAMLFYTNPANHSTNADKNIEKISDILGIFEAMQKATNLKLFGTYTPPEIPVAYTSIADFPRGNDLFFSERLRLPSMDKVFVQKAPNDMNKEDLIFLHTLANKFAAPLDESEKENVGALILSLRTEILQARQDSQAITPAKLWELTFGEKSPYKLTNENCFLAITAELNSPNSKLMKVLDSVEHISEQVKQVAVNLTFFYGVKPSRFIELQMPGAKLTKNDILFETKMSSLTNYTADNAYGLCIDFHRAGSGSIFSFIDTKGAVEQFSPQNIPGEEQIPTNPIYVSLIDAAAKITQTEVQKARVIQAYTQASLVIPRMISGLFCGQDYSEHGQSIIKSTAQADGTVIIDIANDPAHSDICFNMQLKIGTDGSQESTVFDMWKK